MATIASPLRERVTLQVESVRIPADCEKARTLSATRDRQQRPDALQVSRGYIARRCVVSTVFEGEGASDTPLSVESLRSAYRRAHRTR